ncbi:MAG TPA: hypothetical protein VFD36_31640 [Kofleriaceae bacterium]|nr:hypothetical protein [Kofleriaceae bacterium]
MLARLQKGLERMYRIETEVSVDDFMIDERARRELGVSRAPREQLLVSGDGGEVSLGLFVDERALCNLAENDPADGLDDRNLGDFLLAVEGVSHFVYLTWRALRDHRVTALELELQAEVDKYVTCLLTTEPAAPVSAALRRRLFGDAAYDADLDHDEHARYRAANDNAQRYTTWLERAFVVPRRIPEMLAELRRFYRLGLAAKLGAIARAA